MIGKMTSECVWSFLVHDTRVMIGKIISESIWSFVVHDVQDEENHKEDVSV